MRARTWRGSIAPVLVLAAALVAGCGSSPTPVPPAAPTLAPSPATTNGNTGAYDVCGLLAAGDLERSFGQKMKVAQSLPPGSWAAGSCTWEGTDTAKPASLNVMVGTGATMAAAGITDPTKWVKETGDAAAKIYGGAAEAVSGVGDQAVRAGNATAGQLIFCRRSTCAQVVVIGIGTEALSALGTSLANGL